MRSCVQTSDWYYKTISYTVTDSSACSHRRKKHLSVSVWNNMSWEYKDGVHTVVITSKSLLGIPSLRLTSLLLRSHSELGNTSNSKSPHDLTAGGDSGTVWDWSATGLDLIHTPVLFEHDRNNHHLSSVFGALNRTRSSISYWLKTWWCTLTLLCWADVCSTESSTSLFVSAFWPTCAGSVGSSFTAHLLPDMPIKEKEVRFQQNITVFCKW